MARETGAETGRPRFGDAVMAAIGKVPRHRFVPVPLQSSAYDNRPLPIGEGQTISQPYTVALMTELLRIEPGMRVLEIGTGSGYQAAILARIGAEVYTVERIPKLCEAARERLLSQGYFSAHVKLDDGTLGWPSLAPFERILVTAGGPEVPPPLVDQLAEGGRLLLPVGTTRKNQCLVLVEKARGLVEQTEICGVQFVDLVGAHGW